MGLTPAQAIDAANDAFGSHRGHRALHAKVGMRLRKVPCDEQFRLAPEQLGDLGEAALVVATVGTTATTSVDTC